MYATEPALLYIFLSSYFFIYFYNLVSRPVLLSEDKLTLSKERYNQVWLNLTLVILFLSLPPLNSICHLFDQITAETLINSKERFILQNPVPCCLLVFGNSIFAFTFFALFGHEKLCLARSPPFADSAVTPMGLVMTSYGKIPASFPNNGIIRVDTCLRVFSTVNNTEAWSSRDQIPRRLSWWENVTEG